MDVPCPSRRRSRECGPSLGRNMRPRCPRPDLNQLRRRRREEAVAATFAARAAASRRLEESPAGALPACVSAASDRNVSPNLLLSRASCSALAPNIPGTANASPAPRRCTTLSELPSKF